LSLDRVICREYEQACILVLADRQEDIRVLLQADERRQDVLHAGEEDDHDLLPSATQK
jgi:hypothetical protein